MDNSTISVLVTAKVKNSEIDWTGVMRGIVVSMGQVYAVNDVKASCLMNLAVALSSPLLFLTLYLKMIHGIIVDPWLFL